MALVALSFKIQGTGPEWVSYVLCRMASMIVPSGHDHSELRVAVAHLQLPACDSQIVGCINIDGVCEACRWFFLISHSLGFCRMRPLVALGAGTAEKVLVRAEGLVCMEAAPVPGKHCDKKAPPCSHLFF